VLDQRDLVGLHLVGIELQVELHTAVDELRELGADPGVRQVDADLHLLGVRQGGGHDECDDDGDDDSLHHARVPPRRVESRKQVTDGWGEY
jgi:hypothetical protein